MWAWALLGAQLWAVTCVCAFGLSAVRAAQLQHVTQAVRAAAPASRGLCARATPVAVVTAAAPGMTEAAWKDGLAQFAKNQEGGQP